MVTVLASVSIYYRAVPARVTGPERHVDRLRVGGA